MPRRTLAVLAALCPLLAPLAAHAGLVPTDFEDTPIVTGLNEPRALAFLPDGRILFTEQRTGRVRMVVNGAIATQDPLLTINVNANGYERGLQGIAIDPQWPARPYVYVFQDDNDSRNRLYRWTASGALSDPNAQTLTLSNPLVLIDDIPDQDPNHNSGCLRFGPDGMLYVSLGEDEVPCAAKDSTTLRGAILRLDVNGVPASTSRVWRANLLAAGNPLSTPDSNAMLVFAYGMRNPWSFQVDPQSAFLYSADVGEADYEEINEVRAGGMYGWPWREGPLVMPRAACPEPGGQGNAANGFLPPIVAFQRDATLHAFMSACLYRAPHGASHPWPAALDGSLLYADYYIGAMHRMVKNGTTGAWSVAPALPGQPAPGNFSEGHENLVDGQIGPDGDLWILRQANVDFDPLSGELRRIRYTGVITGVTPRVTSVALSAGPNPFRTSTVLSFRLPAAADVRLEVLDLTGRRVRTLLAGTHAAGATEAAWDGLDDAGRAARPGLYLARLALDGRAAGHARVLLVR